MKKPFHLLRAEVSRDTLTALDALRDDARKGELIGIAYAAMYKGRTYVVDAAGEAHRSPTFTLGMIEMLASAVRENERGVQGD